MKDKTLHTDQDLLIQFATDRSDAAFTTLVERYSSMVLGVCTRVCHEKQLAEDASQAAFLTLYQKAEDLTKHTSIGGWLMTTARFCALNALKAQKRREHYEREAAAMDNTTSSTPEELWHDLEPCLDQALAALPTKQRDVVILRYMQGLSEQEAAARLDCSRGVVSMRLSRGIKTLRSRLKRNGVEVHASTLILLLGKDTLIQPTASLATSFTTLSAGNGGISKSILTIKDMTMKTLRIKTTQTTLTYAALAIGLTASAIGINQALPDADNTSTGSQQAVGASADPATAAPTIHVLGKSPFQSSAALVALGLKPDGSKLITSSHLSKQVRVWDTQTAKTVGSIPVKDNMHQIHWLSDGNRVVMLEDQEGAFVYDLAKGKELHRFPVPPNARFFDLSEDESIIALPASRPPKRRKRNLWQVVTGEDKVDPSERWEASWTQTHVAAYDVVSGEKLWSFGPIARDTFHKGDKKREYKVESVTLSPDKKSLLCVDKMGKWNPGVGRDDSSRFTLWDVDQQTLINEWYLPKDDYAFATYGPEIIWSAQHKSLFIPAYSKRNKQSVTLEVDPELGTISRTFPGRCVLHKDGYFMSYDHAKGRIVKLDVKTGKEIFAFDLSVKPRRQLSDLQLSKDGGLMMGYDDGSLYVFDLKTKMQLAPIEDAHQGNRSYAMFMADGLMFYSDEMASRLYDGETGNLISSLPSAYFKSVGPQGRSMMSENKLWDLISGTSVKLDSERLSGTTISKSGLRGMITGRSTLDFYNLETSELMFRINEFNAHAHDRAVGGVAWTADHKRVFIAESTGHKYTNSDRKENSKLSGVLGSTGVYDAETGERLFRFSLPGGAPVESAFNLALCEEKDLVYMHVATGPFDESNPFRGLWRASDGSFVRKLEANPSQTSWADFKFLPDNDSMVSTFGLYDIATGKARRWFRSPGERSLSPSGTLYAGWWKNDDTVALYSVRTDEELWRFKATGSHQENIKYLSWHPSEARFAVTTADSLALFLADPFSKVEAADSSKEIDTLLQDLKSDTGTTYRDAVRGLVAHENAAVAPLAKLLINEGRTAQRALFVLEWLSRNGSSDALAQLNSVATSSQGLLSTCAADALYRLEQAEKTEALSKENAALRQKASSTSM